MNKNLNPIKSRDPTALTFITSPLTINCLSMDLGKFCADGTNCALARCVAPKAKWEKMRLVYSESYNRRRKKKKTRFRTSRPFGERQGISEKMHVEVYVK